jgi:hypothetical protein
MRVKTVIKRVVIGIAVFFAAIGILGVILQITGYQPPAKAKPVQDALTEAPARQPDPALLEPIDPARTDINPGVIKYDVASVEPGHIGIIQRYTCRIVVYQRLSKVQLALIADTIYQYAQKEMPFNALEIANGIDAGLSPMERAMPDIARRYNMSQDDVWKLLMKANKGYERKP